MKAQVAVVGGGPVGLYQALALQRAGIDAVVLERDARAHRGSRSIGIHPPSLEALAELDLASPFVGQGVHVRRGHALGPDGPLGIVDFGRCGGTFPFVLALPQHHTERILSDALDARQPEAVRRGAEVTKIELRDNGVRLETSMGAVDAEWVIACDGRRSRMRELLDIEFQVKSYDGSYAMEDHPDSTDFGVDAAVFLSPEGLVESFPLPGGKRRWVARTDGRDFSDVVRARTGFRLNPKMTSRSTFRAERGLASRLIRGRVVFAGDAAHVVSPIGGQGMNLGWLGAVRITRALREVLAGDHAALERDAVVRARMARAAARRAEVNMWLGRPTVHQRAREFLVKTLLRPPCARSLAKAFTMQGLQWGI